MPPADLEPAVPASEQPQTNALNSAVQCVWTSIFSHYHNAHSAIVQDRQYNIKN
jgi:hypothetical protein